MPSSSLMTMCYAAVSSPSITPCVTLSLKQHMLCNNLITTCHASVSSLCIILQSYHGLCFTLITTHHATASPPCHTCRPDHIVGLAFWSSLPTSTLMANEKRVSTSEISQTMKTALFWGWDGGYAQSQCMHKTWVCACVFVHGLSLGAQCGHMCNMDGIVQILVSAWCGKTQCASAWSGRDDCAVFLLGSYTAMLAVFGLHTTQFPVVHNSGIPVIRTYGLSALY